MGINRILVSQFGAGFGKKIVETKEEEEEEEEEEERPHFLIVST
jgi:hypothetical protein